MGDTDESREGVTAVAITRRNCWRLYVSGYYLDPRSGAAPGPDEQRIERELARIERVADRAARERPQSGPVRLSE